MESTVLLVEPDPSSQRVMEVSLRKVGFAVHSAANQSEALALAGEISPQMILCDAQLPDGSGYELCLQVRNIDALKQCSIIIMSEDSSPKARIDAITAGADEFMRKPVRIKEIINRTTALLDRQAYDTLTELDDTRNFSGTLEDIGLIDLLQLIENGNKTCIVHLASDPDKSGGFADPDESGRIYCRDGHIIDAELIHLNGADAVYRMMLWDNGGFEIEFTPLGREDCIQLNTPSLVMEGMRRVDQWTDLKDLMPSLNTQLDVDYTALSTKIEELPDEVQGLIRLFDGSRSIRQVLNDAQIADLFALEAITRLFEDKVLFDKRTRPAVTLSRPSSVSLNAWLSSAPAPRRFSSAPRPSTSIPGLPSVLGRAMIPALDTPSEILRPMSVDTAYPQPLDDEPILLTDAARKRPASTEALRPASAEIIQTPRPRTLTAPPAVFEQSLQVPPPAPPRSMTPPSMAPPIHHEQAAEPAAQAPPSNEFAQPRPHMPSPAVVNQTIEKSIQSALQAPAAVSSPASAAHLKEDTAERFFRMYDENNVAEAAGVSGRSTQIAIAAAAGLLIIVLVGLFTQNEEPVSAQAAWPMIGGEIEIESRPAPPAVPSIKVANSAPTTEAEVTPTPDKNASAITSPTTEAAAVAVQTVQNVTPAIQVAESAPSKNPELANSTPKKIQSPVIKPGEKTSAPAVIKRVAKPPIKTTAVSSKAAAKPAKKLLPRKPKKPKSNAEVQDRLNQAEQSLDQKDLSAAAAGFKKVVSLSKSNHNALSGLALTLVSQGKAKMAVKHARRALKYSKYKSARGYLALGLAYSELEKDKKAIKTLKRFLRIAPNDARASEIESFIESLEEEDE